MHQETPSTILPLTCHRSLLCSNRSQTHSHCGRAQWNLVTVQNKCETTFKTTHGEKKLLGVSVQFTVAYTNEKKKKCIKKAIITNCGRNKETTLDFISPQETERQKWKWQKAKENLATETEFPRMMCSTFNVYWHILQLLLARMDF